MPCPTPCVYTLGCLRRNASQFTKDLKALYLQSISVMPTFLVNTVPRPSVLKRVQKFCAWSLWYFARSLIGATENMYGHSVLSPYSTFCAFSVLKQGIFSSALSIRYRTMTLAEEGTGIKGIPPRRGAGPEPKAEGHGGPRAGSLKDGGGGRGGGARGPWKPQGVAGAELRTTL